MSFFHPQLYTFLHGHHQSSLHLKVLFLFLAPTTNKQSVLRMKGPLAAVREALAVAKAQIKGAPPPPKFAATATTAVATSTTIASTAPATTTAAISVALGKVPKEPLMDDGLVRFVRLAEATTASASAAAAATSPTLGKGGKGKGGGKGGKGAGGGVKAGVGVGGSGKAELNMEDVAFGAIKSLADLEFAE